MGSTDSQMLSEQFASICLGLGHLATILRALVWLNFRKHSERKQNNALSCWRKWVVFIGGQKAVWLLRISDFFYRKWPLHTLNWVECLIWVGIKEKQKCHTELLFLIVFLQLCVYALAKPEQRSSPGAYPYWIN